MTRTPKEQRLRRPFTGFDPMDGDDPRVTLSRDNPCRVDNQRGAGLVVAGIN